ncbi:hypothetical protein F443_23239, partial [Phytophthora nicotianae P1569]
MWLAEGRVPRLPGYVLVGSRRYAEWQNLAFQAAADEIDDVPEEVDLPGPAVERPSYATPTRILPRPTAISPGSRAAESSKPRPGVSKTISAVTVCDKAAKNTNEANRRNTDEASRSQSPFVDRVTDDTVCHTRDESTPSRDQEFSTGCDSATEMCDRLTETGPNQIRNQDETGSLRISNQDRRAETSFGQDRRAKTGHDQDRRMCVEQDRRRGTGARQDCQMEAETFLARNQDRRAAPDLGDEEVCISEGGDLHAEDVSDNMAVLPDVAELTEE